MIGADILLKSLIKEKVNTIFGYPGGATIPFHDRIKHYPIKHILPRNEQGGAMAADAYFRVTGKVGVCMGTSGPGATNLITGIANAYMDSVGMVAITCQVASPLVGTDAFQEVDITGITQPIVKHNYFVDKTEDIPQVIKEAFFLASTGRPRPVHIDITTDALKNPVKKFSYPKKVNIPGYKLATGTTNQDIDKAIKLIKTSSRPIIIAGHGAVISRSGSALKKFIEKTNIPLLTTLLGIGVVPETHKLNFGMLGMHGMAWANFATSNADLIISLGSRFDDRITGKLSEFANDANIIHVDIDRAELNKNTKANLAVNDDILNFLTKLNKKINHKKSNTWIEKIQAWREKYNLPEVIKASRTKKCTKLRPQEIIAEIDKQTKGQATIISDVGQNQMWSAQHYKYLRPENLLSSGGLGTMGYSLPASIGAQIGNPRANVWAIMGDGGFQMNMQELGTIMEHKLPIKIIILNNGFLGMVRQWQELFYDKNYAATPMANPDFPQIAKAYNIESHRITKWSDAQNKIAHAHNSRKSIFLEFIIGSEDKVLPMMPPGGNLKDTFVKI